MVEWIKKNYEKIAGWLDGQEKQKDGWMDKKNVWIERKMDGWIKQIGWMEENKSMDGWKKQEWIQKYEKIDGWIGKKFEKNGCMVVWIPHTQLFIIYNIPIHYT